MVLSKHPLQAVRDDETKRSVIAAMLPYERNGRFSPEYYRKLMILPTGKSNAQQNAFSTPLEVYLNNHAKYLQLRSHSSKKRVLHCVNLASRDFRIYFSQTMNLLYASVH